MQILSGAALYAATIVISYWMLITGLIIIVLCQVLWIGVTVASTE